MASVLDINIARGLMLGDGFRKLVIKVTGPVLYTAAGGDAFLPNAVRVGTIEYMPPFFLTKADGTAVYLGVYNYDTGKLQYFDATFAEVGAIDLSGYAGRAIIFGK